jgi:hypothetical protein
MMGCVGVHGRKWFMDRGQGGRISIIIGFQGFTGSHELGIGLFILGCMYVFFAGWSLLLRGYAGKGV